MSDCRSLGAGVFGTPHVVRRAIALALSVAFLSALPVQADGLKDRIIADLVDEGYTEITIKRTLLGRALVVARQGNQTREIVFNPATQMVLRDYSRIIPTQSDSSTAVSHSEREENERSHRPPAPQETRNPADAPKPGRPAKPDGPIPVSEDMD